MEPFDPQSSGGGPNVWHVLQFLFGGIIAVLTWVAKSTLERVTDLERNKTDKSVSEITRTELQRDISELSDRLDRHHHDVTMRLDTILTRVTMK